MPNPLTDPQEALAFIAELDQELVGTELQKVSQHEKKQSAGKHGDNLDEPEENRKTRHKRPSFEDNADKLMHMEEETSEGTEWPNMDEVESILSEDTGTLGQSDLKTVLRGLVRQQAQLISFVEASKKDMENIVEQLTRRVEFLGVPSSLKAGILPPTSRVTFASKSDDIKAYFLPGNEPPTLKVCRLKLQEIVQSTPGPWKSQAQIIDLDPSVLLSLKNNWSEEAVRAVLETQVPPSS
jgi:hypothetical protein